MSRKPKVLIFSISSFSLRHGGILCAADLLENLRRATDANLTLVSSWHADAEEANTKFASDLELNHIFVQLRDVPTAHRGVASGRIATTVRDLATLLMEKYYFLYERFSRKREHLDIALAELVNKAKPDLIVINGIMSAVCVPSAFLQEIPCCFITHNHEIDIHKDIKLHGSPTDLYVNGRLTRWIAARCNWISNMRFRNYVGRLYKRCTGIIALTNNDLPNDLPPHVMRAVLPPLLKESDLRWRYQGRRCVLFVGNISYFANRLAVEWICSQLAPELLRTDDKVQINIIGATADDIPHRWQFRNINFLGNSDKEEVTHHMVTDDLFIAPTAQHYGAKLKLAECASHGMPFIATNTAMGGLPFLTFVPRFDLDQPAAAAYLVMKCLNGPGILTKLSRDVTKRMEQARREQALAWSSFIKDLLTQQNPLSTGQSEGGRFIRANTA